MNNFKESLTIKDGRYEVSIPWKEDQVILLRNNYVQAERAIKGQDLPRYAINRYVQDGIAEEVPPSEINPANKRPVFYLPHHAVIYKVKTVLDDSAKDINGKS